MPTYEYVCTDCDNHWEEVQKISESPLEVCPKCGKSTAKRQISGGNFILKGGGWYADAYSSVPKPKGGGESKPASSESTTTAPSTPTKTDSGGSGSGGGSSGGGSSGGGSSGPTTPK